MIKNIFLVVVLILCTTNVMAQNPTLIEENYEDDNESDRTTAVYDIYSDGTAVLKKYYSHTCNISIFIPASVNYNGETYQLVEIADKVFYNETTSNLTIGDKVFRITIDNNAKSTLKLGDTPLGRWENESSSIELVVSHCIDASKWEAYFNIIYSPEMELFFNTFDDDGFSEPAYLIPYNGDNSDLEPFSLKYQDYTLIVEQSSLITDNSIVTIGDYPISLETATIKFSNEKSCKVKIPDGGLTVLNAVKVTRTDLTDISEDNLLLSTNSKFYPIPSTSSSNAIVCHVRTGGRDETYSDDYVECNGHIPVLGLTNTDTLCVECTHSIIYDKDKNFIKINIAHDAQVIGSYGGGSHYSSTNYNSTLNLKEDVEFRIPLSDPYPVFVNKTPEDRYEEITGKEPINHSTQTWTDYWFEVDGKRYEHGFFINYNEEDFANLKTYDGTTDISASTRSVTLKLKQRFNPTIGAVNRISSDWLAFDPQAYCIEKQIDIDCSLAFDNPNVGTDKTIKLTITPTDDFYKGLIGGSYSVTLNTKGTITPIQLDDVLEVRDAIYNALGKERNKPYDGSSMLVPNHKTITLDKEDTGLPDNVQVSLSNLQYFGQDGEWKPSAEHGKHTIVMDLELVLNDNDNTNNYCFFRRDNETSYTENWLYQGEDKYTGEIIPVEITLTEEMFYLTFPKERPFDGTNLVYDHLGKIVNPDNPQMFLANPEYMINGNFQITNALYKSAEVTDPDPNSIILTIKNLSGNYIINNLGDGNTFAISGNITPAELDVTIEPEDIKECISLQRQYNPEDLSATIKTAQLSKNGHNFVISSAKFTDNSIGVNKQIDVTIQLNDNNPNYVLKNSTFNISGGKIWDYATIALNNNKFAEGKATIGTDIIATATYNEQNIEGTFTYTPAAGTQLTQGTHEITATFNSACDYIDSSTQKFTVEVNGSAIIIKEESIQQQTDPYCMEGVDGLTIKFAKLSGDIKRFKIEIDGEEKLSEYMSSKGEIKSGQYSGTIQFFDESGEIMSEKYPFTITVYKPSSMVKYLYHNVIFVDNHDELFSDYQWYKNGEKIDGATRQYYYEKVLNGNYYVVCKTNSGIKIKSCPVDGDLSAKISISSVKVYPNPAQANIPFNLELVGGNGNYSGAEMMIYNNSGNLVKHITNITDIITLTLPQGNYSGALFFNGEKTGFKIIVK